MSRLNVMGLAGLLVAAACSEPGAPGGPDIQLVLADSIVLQPGEASTVQALRLSFVGVSGDSRCPVDAVCIWQGNAAVEIALAVGSGSGAAYTLDTSDPLAAIVVENFRVTLLTLAPEAHAGVPIPATDYRAAFRVESLDP